MSAAQKVGPLRIRVPASVANLGPGFDSLALAVRLYNELEVQPLDAGLQLRIQGEGQATLPTDERNLIVRAARLLAERRGRSLPGLRLVCRNHIPLAAGLGSSAAASVAGLLAAEALLRDEASPEGLTSDSPTSSAAPAAGPPRAELLALANQLEGHADNAAAALFGGLVIVGSDDDRPIYHRVEPAIRELLVVIPQLELSTQEMRKALPSQVALGEAAFNLGRAALTIEALRAGDYALLAEAMIDRLHQPYRQQHIPGFAEVVAAARQAGAAAVALAGAGPGLVAFAEQDLLQVGRAMVEAFDRRGVPARELLLQVDLQGAMRWWD